MLEDSSLVGLLLEYLSSSILAESQRGPGLFDKSIVILRIRLFIYGHLKLFSLYKNIDEVTLTADGQQASR